MASPAIKPKPIYRSKTNWMAAYNVAILYLVPGAREWVSENPEAYALILSVTIVVFRKITKEAVSWRSSKQ